MMEVPTFGVRRIPGSARSTLGLALALVASLSTHPAEAASVQRSQDSQAGQASAWAELARRDIAAIRQTLLDHHAGPVDPLNPDYREWLDVGHDSAMALASRATSLDHVVAAISFYTAGFEDGHLGWRPFYRRGSVRWPGFVVGRRQGRFVVTQRADWSTVELPTVGAEVLACDGEGLEDRLTGGVMHFRVGLPALESSKVRLAPYVLIDDRNPWLSVPGSCVFEMDGRESRLDLEWRGIPRSDLDGWIADAAYGERPTTFAVEHPTPGVAWIRIPSLAENTGDNDAGLLRIVAAMPGARESDLIVFDLRGNRGGNSAWTHRILDPLFGEEYVGSATRHVGSGVYVQWRASSENADFVEKYALPRNPPSSRHHQFYVDLIAELRSGVEMGRPLTGGGNEGSPVPEEREPIRHHPLGLRTILLTDGWCASACLDFADVLLSIPGVRHAGAQTFADAVYIDNRSIVLPSGLGRFTFSMKVYRNRLRGHNEPYEPDLPYSDTDWSTEAVQGWLIDAAATGS